MIEPAKEELELEATVTVKDTLPGLKTRQKAGLLGQRARLEL